MLTLLTLAAGVVRAQDISGDWLGTLSAGGAELRLALHITKSIDGSFSGTMDSLDQGANGIPLSSIALKDSKLTLSVDAVHGTYEGTVNAAGSSISGNWSQGQSLPLEFKRGAVKKAAIAPPSDIDGAWMGTLDAGAAKLRLVFHFTNTADGLTATMDSPDQGVKGIPVNVTRKDASLKIEMKQAHGSYDGTIDKDLQTIQGTWTQGGKTFPVVLKPVKDSAELADPVRPQNPTKPYPYRSEDVTYTSPVAHIQLAATFTIPEGKGPFPAVVLITGSGPQDRDETLMGHKPFLVLSDYLTRHGVAVLRADDRGIGKSGGQFTGATTADFATDAEASLAYLKARPEADPHKLGLIGHSEGAMIAPMVAARNHDVAFIVMLAGPGVPGDQILLEQGKLIMAAGGMSAEDIDKQQAPNRDAFALIRSEQDGPALDKQLHNLLTREVPPAELDQELKSLNSPWFRYFLRYDPAVALRKVTCPVLALNGEKDLQVPPAQNLPAVRAALREAGNKHFEADEMPGLNHLFQTAKTGSPSEYSHIEETLSPNALKKVADWINSLS
jgi:pimeloyl-ACP methyl ester carboxylesterase